MTNDPLKKHESPPYQEQQQPVPDTIKAMDPVPDHGALSYKGSGKLAGLKAVITGGDSGIGRAVGIAYAREGADVLISYLKEHDDAQDTARYVEEAGRKAILLSRNIRDEEHCRKIIDTAVSELCGIDILLNNAAFQMSRPSLQEVSSMEWDQTFKTNIYPLFHLCKLAEPHLKPGSRVINTTSVNAYNPKPVLVTYAATKGAIQNFTASVAQLWGEKGIRVNCVAPGPIWTPLITSTFPPKDVSKFGENVPLKRAG